MRDTRPVRGFAAGLIALIAAGAGAAPPEGEAVPPLEIRAERIAYDPARRVFEASGGVEVVRGDRSLRADRVSFDERTGRGTATGDVRLVDGPDTLRSSHVELDIYAFEGVILDGEFRSTETGFRAEGARIEKTGAKDYRLEDGRLTTCDCPDAGPDPWAIRASEAELTVEGYGTARNARFEVLGVPLVWVPWLLYPVKVERQSGLLLPELTLSGRSGVELGLPLFLALGDPVNLTLTPRWLSERGPKGDVDLEWVAGRESGGHLFGSFLSDDKVDANSPEEPFDRERWAVKGEQDLQLPLASRFKADFDFVSDNQYPVDFDEMGGARTQRFLESTASLGRAFGAAGTLGLVASADYADDLQNPDDADRDDFVLQRLPQLDATLLPSAVALPVPLLARLVPSLGARFTWFDATGSALKERPSATVVGKKLFLDTGIDALPNAQERGSDGGPEGPPPADPNADDFTGDPARGTEGDGRFQEGEPLADRGGRLLLTPRLGAPLRLFDLLELYPEIGWHQALYQSDAQSFEETGLLTGRADLRARLRRRFGEGLVHVIEPRLSWAFVSDQGQSTKPLYVPRTAAPQRRLRQLDLDNLVLDPADRISDTNRVALGVGNRLYGAGLEGGAARLVADLLLSGAYETTGARFDAFYLDARAHPWERSDAWLVLGLDPEQGRLDEALVDLGWRFEKGHRLGFDYRYLQQVGRFFEDFRYARKRFRRFEGEFRRVHEVGGRARWMLGERWALSYRGGFSFEEAIVLANRGGVEYFSRCGCWSAGVELAQDRVRGVSLSFVYSLTGFGKDDLARAAERRRRSGGGFLDSL